MATTQLPKASVIISELTQVEEQIEAVKQQGGEARSHRKALETMSSKLADLQPLLEEQGASGNIGKTVADLAKWAEVMAPNASVTWNREEVNAKLQLLDALATLGQLTEVEGETVARLKVTLKASKVGGGERAPRQAQPKIEGRPDKVSIAGPDGTVFSVQSGNVANSAPNLKTAAVAFVRKATDAEVTAEDSKGLLAAAKEVVEGKSTSETYEGITFAVYTEPEE